MKISGAEFREWHDTAWPVGYIWSEEGSEIAEHGDLYGETGEISLEPTAVFVIPSFWSLDMEDGPWHRKDGGFGLSVRKLIADWRKSRAFETIVITVPREEATKAKDLCIKHGWQTT